jgi:hypothetical protein
MQLASSAGTGHQRLRRTIGRSPPFGPSSAQYDAGHVSEYVGSFGESETTVLGECLEAFEAGDEKPGLDDERQRRGVITASICLAPCRGRAAKRLVNA